MSNSLRPPRMGFSRQESGVHCHCLLQATFLIQRSNPGLLHCRKIFYYMNREYIPLKYINTHAHGSAHIMTDTFQKSEVISCNTCVSSKKNYFTLGPLTTSATVRKGYRMTVQGPSSFRTASFKGLVYSSFP